MSRSGPSPSSTRRIVLLAGQAFALGLMMAWITVPAGAVFLDTYGASLLPVTYIGAALAGAAVSAGLARALRHRPLVDIATRVLAGTSLGLLVCWLLLSKFDAEWVSFGLLVVVPIIVPVGFIFVVGQAGALLDVRVLKALYGRVVAGFALGFAAGGLAGPYLLTILGQAEHILAVAALAAGTFLALVLLTRSTFPIELGAVEHDDLSGDRPTLRALARDRYVLLIVGFQMLSAVESQWLDYLVFDRAAQRYDDSDSLARFISQFTVIAYGADIVFLVLVAGLLLRRFGLRYGLTANGAGVLTLLIAVIAMTSLHGGATVVFVLIVAARVTDLVLADGSSRTSLSAAYQVVPSRLRLAAQATTEGLAVPVAIGFSGLGLLVLQWTVGSGGLVLPVLTTVVVGAWLVVAVLLYRMYRISLLASLRRRTLDPTALMFHGAVDMTVIERLVGGGDERDVRLALDTLAGAEDPGLPTILRRLAVDEQVEIRADALSRLVEFDPHSAAMLARPGLAHENPIVRAASVRVLQLAGEPSDHAGLAAAWHDASTEVRLAAAAALSESGNEVDRTRIDREITRLATSTGPEERVLAARVLGECRAGSVDRAPLRRLLDDADHDVVNAALAAIRWPVDTALLADIVHRLEDRWTAGAAVDALARLGDPAVELADRSLRDSATSPLAGELLARVCRDVGGTAAVAVLSSHLGHPDRDVGLAVMRSLAALTDTGADVDPQAVSSVLSSDVAAASHLLDALVALQDESAGDELCAALRDELDLVRHRVLAALSIRHGVEPLGRVAFRLAQPEARSHALALEWLDVTISGTDRAAISVLDPALADVDRLRALRRRATLAPSTADDVLRDLVLNTRERWQRPWLVACALHAAASRPEGSDIVEAAAVSTAWLAADVPGFEIAIETLTAIQDRRTPAP